MTKTVAAGKDAGRALESCVTDGGIAVFPADTVYGLACDPLDAGAVRRVNELKGRDSGKPSAVMYFAPLAMREMLLSLDEPTRDALGALLPGPVTAVVANTGGRYPLACGSDPSRLGLRLIDGPLAGARCPVLQTSANRAGAADARSVGAIDAEIRDGVDLVIDGGELPGTPSTVVDLSPLVAEGRWEVLREGALSESEIGARLARVAT